MRSVISASGSAVQQQIAAGLAEPYQRKLARSILATDSVEAIADSVTEIVSTQLGWNRFECFLFEISVGAVVGVSLGETRCLIKYFGPDSNPSDVLSRVKFQGWLHDQGYPCPKVLVFPSTSRKPLIAIEAYVDVGRRADGHAKLDRELMAVELARLVQLGKTYPHLDELPENVLEEVSGSPWPKPHNVLFDFDATMDGAEWIDDIGRQYKSVLELSPEAKVAGHFDWGAKHCRIEAGEISVIYDWDSVARLLETKVVGSAAVNFTASWYVKGALRPSIEELVSFVRGYEHARAINFSRSEIELIVAAIRYGAGYGARCEYANAMLNGSESTEYCEFLEYINGVDLIETLSRH